MRSLVARLLVAIFMFTNLGLANEKVSKGEFLLNLYKDFKRQILLKDQKPEEVVKHFATSIAAYSISLDDIESYVAENASLNDYLKFRNQISTLKEEFSHIDELDEESMIYVNELFTSIFTQEGANFYGCDGMISIGSVMAFVTVGILVTSLVKLISPEFSTRIHNNGYESWDEFRQNELNKHENNIKIHESEIAGYEQQIVENNLILEGLEQQLLDDSLTANEIDEISKLIRDHKFKVTDAEALIQEVIIDINYFEASHEALMVRTYEWDKIDDQIIKDEKRNGKILLGGAIASGVLTTLLFTQSDC